MKIRKKENLVVGIGYYRRKDWQRFLASADDREDLEDTYDEWLVSFRNAVKNMRKAGMQPKRVIFRLDELLDYCKKKRLKNNAQARSEFFVELTRQGRTEEIAEI